MKIAIIGGTGHALPDYLTDVQEIAAETPFGMPHRRLLRKTAKY